MFLSQHLEWCTGLSALGSPDGLMEEGHEHEEVG